MAANIQLNLLLNKADAANSIKETKAAIKDLQNAALNLEQGSPGFNKLIAKAGELKDRINDVQDTTRVLAGNTVENLTSSFARMSASAVGGLQAIIGLQTVFGNESKATMQTLAQLQGLMAFTSGIKEFANLGQSVKDFSTAMAVAITKITAKTTVQEAETVATVAGTEAQIANNLAVAASPIGLLVIGLMAAAGAFMYFKNKNEESTKSVLEFNNKITDLESDIAKMNTNFSNSVDKFLLSIGGITKGQAAINEAKRLLYETTIEDANAIEKLQNNALKDKDLSDKIKKYYSLSPNEQAKYLEDIDNINLKSYIADKKFLELKKKNNEQVLQQGINAAEMDNYNSLQRINYEKIYTNTLLSQVGIRNEFNKKDAEIAASRKKEIDNLNLSYNSNVRNTAEYRDQLAIINNKYNTLEKENQQARQDKLNQLKLNGRQIDLNILKENYVKTVDTINSQYETEKQLLKDKLKENERLNKGNTQTIINLRKQEALDQLKLEKDKNNALLILQQEQANRAGYILANRIQSALVKGNAPSNLIGDLERVTRQQALADFAVGESGKKLAEAGKYAGSSAEATKLYNDLLAEQQAFVETRMRGIETLKTAILQSNINISKANSDIYEKEKSVLDRIHSMTVSEFLKNQNDLYELKKEQLQKQRDFELANTQLTEQQKAEIRAKYALQESQLAEENRNNQINSEIKLLEAKSQYTQIGMDTLAGIYDLTRQQIDAKDEKQRADQEKRAKDQFYVFKALNLGLATIQGFVNAQAAYKRIALADPIEKPVAIATFIATVAQSALTVAKIAATQYQSSASGGAGSSQQQSAPSINLYGQGGTQNNLTVANQNTRDKDIRVYVVENDIATAQTNIARYKTSVQLG